MSQQQNILEKKIYAFLKEGISIFFLVDTEQYYSITTFDDAASLNSEHHYLKGRNITTLLHEVNENNLAVDVTSNLRTRMEKFPEIRYNFSNKFKWIKYQL